MSSRSLVVLLVLATAGLSWLHAPTSASAIDLSNTAKVRLFSSGQVVGEWEAVGPGRVEGDTFVFPVRAGTQQLSVRISGTFTYETQR